MTDKEKSFIEIEKLVNRFAEQEEFYKQPTYNETETRRDFIDPFFSALGWDIDNKKGLLPTEREVNHEKNVDTKKGKKTADYSFNVNGKIQFYVEAKKPSVSLKDDPKPAIQLRNYGWNSNINISILTDFEEFSIYDCTKKIKNSDKASKSRIKFIHYKDYLKDFDFIYDTFSHKSIIDGSLNQFIKKNINDREKETVDKEFLKSLENWRTYLATNIASNNKLFDEDVINYCVQQTIDRIVFLKICEDREVEQEGNLKRCLKKGNYYNNLFDYFKTADQKYNSGIFDFKKDIITADIKIDNKIIKSIIDDFDEIGYDFSKIPIEILGYAYEQFLGKVIRLEKSGHAIIETKPEVRKAGGVFYTPEYIVNYIVKNTVGKLIENKTPEEISKIKILDPACGSGSFLLGAYQFLLNYHQNYYIKKHKGKITKDSPINQDGSLKTSEKKRILVNNIFGVDIDTQAVEVTKLSLLIKAMEGETTSTIETSLKLFHQRVLPNLDSNILAGNSLISPDFEGLGLTPKEERKINVFDWKESFKTIFNENNGFDVVIGNPPYVFTRDVEWGESVKNYFWDNFAISNGANKTKKNQSGKVNLYILFILKSLQLINKSGVVSFIVPNGLLRTTTYDTTRKYLINNTSIDLIIDLKDGVFSGVTASTVIFQLSKFKEKNITKILDANYKKDAKIDETKENFILQEIFKKNTSYTFNIFVNEAENTIFSKIQNTNFYLKNIVIDIIEGIVAHKEFVTDKKKNAEYREMLEGKDLKRYTINYGGNYVLFDRKKLHRARPDYVWEAEKKVLIQRISGGEKPLVAAIDTNKYLCFASINVLLIKPEFLKQYSYELICAILNSNLINFYYSKNFTNSSTLTVNISKTFLEMIPLPIVDIKDKTQKIIVEKIENNVIKIRENYKELEQTKLPQQKELIHRKILNMTNQINENIYQLYDINDINIKIIEKK